MNPLSPIPNARSAANVARNLAKRAEEATTPAARQWYTDAAAMLAPDRWRSVSARPALAGRLCQVAAGIITITHNQTEGA